MMIQEYHERSLINTRIKYIDMAKCISMIAVILGHTTFQKPNEAEQFIFAFHMPLFYIASGFFFHQTGINKEYIRKLVKSLLIPYILTIAGIIIVNICIDLVNHVDIWGNIEKWLSAALYGSGSRKDWTLWFPTKIVVIGLVWFLLALFWAKILLACIFKAAQGNMVLQAILVCGIAWSGYYMSEHSVWLPFSIYAGMTSTFFLWIGYLFKKHEIVNRKMPVVLLLVFIYISVYITLHVKAPYLVSNRFKGGFMNVIGAIVISYLILRFCYVWEEKSIIGAKTLSFFGRDTLLLAAIHQIEAKFIIWKTDVPKMLSQYGLPATYWTVGLTRCLFVFIAFLLIKGICFGMASIRKQIKG